MGSCITCGCYPYPREATQAFLAAAHLASRDSAFWTATTARSATRNALFAYSRAILAMVSALLHASSKCLPVKKCSDNVEAIRDTGSRREALVICTRATVGARQRLWVSQVWFLDPGFFVDSGEDTYYKHCGRFTFEKSHVLASRMAFLRTGRPKPGHERRSCHPLCQLLQQLRLLHLQKL